MSVLDYYFPPHLFFTFKSLCFSPSFHLTDISIWMFQKQHKSHTCKIELLFFPWETPFVFFSTEWWQHKMEMAVLVKVMLVTENPTWCCFTHPRFYYVYTRPGVSSSGLVWQFHAFLEIIFFHIIPLPPYVVPLVSIVADSWWRSDNTAWHQPPDRREGRVHLFHLSTPFLLIAHCPELNYRKFQRKRVNVAAFLGARCQLDRWL